MNNPYIVAILTLAIISLSAFFVAVEFALIAARRHRLEDAAASSRAARAALRSSTELTVLLAGSQLGITVCTLALGAITKPAVHHWLTPLFEAWGLATWLADVVGFVLALVIVTFLHLVVGEMAPKSWAIAHPERSAIALALPMRGFMWLTRPLLRLLNEAANWCLRRVGVEPVDEVAAGQTPDDLRQLVQHSANVGVLDASFSAQLSSALDLRRLNLGELLDGSKPVSIPATATVGEVQEVSRRTGHLRIIVEGGKAMVHVRDTLVADEAEPVTPFVRETVRFAANTPAPEALAQMQRRRQHLAVVTRGDQMIGVVTLSDVLRRLFPEVAGAA